MFRRVRSTCRRTSYEYTQDTKIENVRHKNQDFNCILLISYHSQKPEKLSFFQFFFSRKST